MSTFVGFDWLQAEETTFVGADLPPPAALFEAEAPPERELVRASAPAPSHAEFRRRCAAFHAARTTAPPLDEIRRIAALPQHLPDGSANRAWLDARLDKITGSAIGALAGVNPYESPEDKVVSLVWRDYAPFTGNEMTRWGNEHEDDAQAAFALAAGVAETRIENPGLVIDRTRGHMAMSPDGVLRTERADGSVELALLEYKCPWGCRHLTTEADVLAKGSLYPRKPIRDARCGVVPLPSYYHAQIQHGMSVLSSLGKPITRSLFVVWCPSASDTVREVARTPESRIVSTPRGTVQITEVARDDAYIAAMYERVDTMWDKYVMACVWRDAACLDEPDLRPSLDVVT